MYTPVFYSQRGIILVPLTKPYHMQHICTRIMAAATLLALQAPTLQAQDIATDSKGKGVFSLLDIQKARFDFSSKDFTVTIRLYKDTIRYYKLLGANMGRINSNVTKVNNFYLQASMLNASNILTYADLSNFRPGAKLRFGYQVNPVEINNQYTRSTYSWGMNVWGSVDNFKHYDPKQSAAITKKYPWSYGVETNYTWFLPRFWAKKRWVAMSFSGAASRGWNDNALLNFRERNKAIVDTVAVALDKFSGKYGELVTDINRARFSGSIPVKVNVKDGKWYSFLNYYSVVPYAVVNYIEGSTPVTTMGVYNNIFASKLNFSKMELPSSFGVGVDWNYNDAVWSSANWFLRGTINFK